MGINRHGAFRPTELGCTNRTNSLFGKSSDQADFPSQGLYSPLTAELGGRSQLKKMQHIMKPIAM
jgi:hypothetical protein